jgi:hypothetical protein
MPEPMTPDLTEQEFDALVGLDGTLQQRRPSPEIEKTLRDLGLIERFRWSGLPVRTASGSALVAAGREQPVAFAAAAD